MRVIRMAMAGLAALTILWTLVPTAEARAMGERKAQSNAAFDYYILALSWSPTYCEQEGAQRDDAQCSSKRRYGFVAHGLWPQNERGPNLEECAKPGWIESDTLRSVEDIMPSRGLAIHEWKKHGVCTGLTPEGYFGALRQAYESVKIPTALIKLDQWITIDPKVIEAAFVEVNPGMTDAGIATVCRSKRLREVRICLDTDLRPRACTGSAARDCRDQSVRMPPVR